MILGGLEPKSRLSRDRGKSGKWLDTNKYGVISLRLHYSLRRT